MSYKKPQKTNVIALNTPTVIEPPNPVPGTNEDASPPSEPVAPISPTTVDAPEVLDTTTEVPEVQDPTAEVVEPTSRVDEGVGAEPTAAIDPTPHAPEEPVDVVVSSEDGVGTMDVAATPDGTDVTVDPVGTDAGRELPTLRAHPAADLFPLLPDDQLAELAEDIRVRGLIEPVVTIEVSGITMILDGRNRHRACVIADVEPRTVGWDGTGGSPSGFVLAKNIHRRHLSPSQRAAIAVDLLPMLEAEARERQVAAAEATNARAHLALVEGVPEPSSEPVVRGRSRDIAASALAVSGRSVGDAKAIAEKAPEVLAEVKAGSLSIPEGRRIAALPTPEERKEAIKDAKGGTGKRKERVPKPVATPPGVTDTLGPVRAAVGNLGKLLDAVPTAERPIWWAALRKAIRAVAAK